MFSGLRARLTLSHLAVILLAMALSGFLLLSFLERYFLQAAETSLMAQARLIAQALIPGAVTEPADDSLPPAYNALQQQQWSNLALQTQNVTPPADAAPSGELDLSYLADASLQLGLQLETHIRFVDDQGVVRVDSHWSGEAPPEEQALREDPLVTQALNGQPAVRTTATTMVLAFPAQIEGRLVGVVYLSQTLRDVTAVLHDVRARLLLSAVIALLLSAGVGWGLSRAISRPLRQLTVAAAAVAQGRFDPLLPSGSRDELGQLSRAFDDMTTRLRAARQMQIDLVANVSHELRTPLTAVKGTVETLRDGAVDDPAVRDRFLETVEGETDRLIRLVNDLMTLSRADSEALNLRRKPLDLVALICATVERLTPQAEARGLLLKVDANAEALSRGPSLWGDPDRLQQVLVNLLDNAIKYSRPGGRVTVRAATGPGDPPAALVQVLDEGIGIPAEELPRVGQRFYRADKSRSRAEGGSGLGLAIAQALIEAHGGRLWLENRASAGVVASFTLPLS